MLKVSKLIAVVWAVSSTALFFSWDPEPGLSPRLQQKLHDAVASTFEFPDYELIHLSVSPEINAKTPVELGGANLFKIQGQGKTLGYAYLGQAPSMKNIFDYVVLLNPDLSIKKSKVLIYREDYGRQIGSQRWLKQFIGKKSGDSLTYGSAIDAISGATISAKSMTNAVADVLASLKVVEQEKAL